MKIKDKYFYFDGILNETSVRIVDRLSMMGVESGFESVSSRIGGERGCNYGFQVLYIDASRPVIVPA